MPMGRRPTKSKSKRGVGRRRRVPRKGARVALPKTLNTGNFASATEQYSLAVTAGQVYDFTFTLQDLIRTNVLAGIFQYYRITGVELRFKPLYDTFVAQGNSGGTALPYLYFQYDKSGALNNLDAPGFEEIGTKAIRMDDKTIIRKWKPSVLIPSPAGIQAFKTAPWMPTIVPGTNDKNDQINHYGAIFYVSKTTSTDSTVYDVDVRINVQYRKPLVQMSSTAPVALKPPRVTQGNTSAIQIES